MRRLFDVILLLAIVGSATFFWYTHRELVHSALGKAQARYAPCRSPITYRIGSIDPNFNISTSTVLSDLKEAEAVWEDASGKNLFEYDPMNGAVPVNFAYDNRQAATDKLTSFGAQVDANMSSYDAMKTQYDSLKMRVASERAQLESSIASYNARERAYQHVVDTWNTQGGAPPAEYQKLQDERASLAAMNKDLADQQAADNKDVSALNALATSLNALITKLNLNVAKYNQIGATVGSEFEEGEYVSEGGQQRIDVYEFTGHTDLVRLMAHEMGHALGLEHVDDPQAIMYKINQRGSAGATAADLTELDRVCASGII